MMPMNELAELFKLSKSGETWRTMNEWVRQHQDLVLEVKGEA